MNILSWIILGLLGGIIMSLMDKQFRFSKLISSSILGILGAFLGGLLASLLFNQPLFGFNLSSILVAIGGMSFLLALNKLVKKDQENKFR